MVPPKGGSIIRGMHVNQGKGGVAIKIRDQPKYETAPAGIIQVEYNLTPSNQSLWYDLSAVDCHLAAGPEDPMYCRKFSCIRDLKGKCADKLTALIDGGMKLYVPIKPYGQCPPAWCSGGKCVNTYDRPGSWEGEPSFKCWAGADLILETCKFFLVGFDSVVIY